jgi:hypothetical protein
MSYNQTLNINFGSNKSFRGFPPISDLKFFYHKPEPDTKRWLTDRNFIVKVIDKITEKSQKIKIEEIWSLYTYHILKYFPTIKSPQITSNSINQLIYLNYDAIFSKSSKLDDGYNLNQVFNDLIKLSLCKMIKDINNLKINNNEKEKQKYEKLKDELIKKVLDTFEAKKNSKDLESVIENTNGIH